MSEAGGDVAAIEQLAVRFARLTDAFDWGGLAGLCTADAVVDMRTAGGGLVPVAEYWAGIAHYVATAPVGASQHLFANRSIELVSDSEAVVHASLLWTATIERDPRRVVIAGANHRIDARRDGTWRIGVITEDVLWTTVSEVTPLAAVLADLGGQTSES